MKKTLIMISALLLCSLSFAQEEAKHQPDEFGVITYETVDHEGRPVTVVIDPPIANPVNNPLEDPESPYFQPQVDEVEKFGIEETSRAATVDVYVVADQTFTPANPNWSGSGGTLYNVVETADNAYYRDYRINWVIKGYYTWTSSNNGTSNILAGLASAGSGLPDGLCMGWTRQSSFTAGGVAYVYTSNPGTGFSVCKDQGQSANISALRHEIGHNYGCSHDFDPVVCLMNYTYSYQIDYFDNAHDNTINSHSGWFGG